MRKTKVDDLASGLVLAADVEDHNGYRILAKGTVLTESQIALLLTWKVLEVTVEDAPAKAEAVTAARSAGDEALEAARERLARRFKGRLKNEYMRALRREAEQRLTVPRYWKTKV